MDNKQFSQFTTQFFKNNNDNIFIPPKNSRDILFNTIQPYLENGIQILEPCAHTGEFISEISQFDISFNITILEENETLFNHIEESFKFIDNLYNTSLLKLSSPHNFKKFDIIIGSPPTKLVDKKTTIGKSFKHWFVNKTYLYTLYFMRSIDLLHNDGIIAFILPDTILNSPYTQLLRNKISSQGEIISIQRLSNLFTRTTYNTLLFVFQKKKSPSNNFKFIINKIPFFHTDTQIYNNIFNGATFLSSLNCKITKGYISRNIDNRSNNINDIPILYTKNIDSDNTLVLFKNNKQYIPLDFIDSDIIVKPSLLISKFYGNNIDEYKINCTLSTLPRYVCNDNLFVVTFPHLNNEESIILITKIIKSFNSSKTHLWQKTFLKDGIISKYQIKHYLPIFI